MKKFLLVLFIALKAATAQDTIPFNFGIAPGLSLRNTIDATVHFNVNLINSRIGTLQGADFAGLVSNIAGTANGYQVAGITASAEELSGFQVSGIFSHVRSDASGYQGSGIVNSIRGDLSGIQSAYIVNRVSGTTYGGQTGFINIANDVNGFQAGFINISRQLNGIPLGIINIAENGRVTAIAYASNFSTVNAGARFIANNFVSTITAGGHDYHNRLDTAAGISTSWGYHIPLYPLYLEIDLASMNLTQLAGEIDRDNLRTRSLTALRLTAGFEITGFIGVFAGAGLGYDVELQGGDFVSDSFQPLYYGGVTLF
ncbi:hypothetical protein QA601_13020 [Chitinispirillales bacterium ANBcel5]|uniref:hypothetical protein n=1 Tax=Cellulosispirillum alkaliphilum TaxID=3039283 RepID=UPI002A4F48EA|nr:hypothetical protein [Chitinispirillales bacterium ANBcel5]